MLELKDGFYYANVMDDSGKNHGVSDSHNFSWSFVVFSV